MTFDWLRHHATERNHTDAILAVTESEPQRRTLHEIASRRAWELFFAGNWSEAESLLARQRFAIVLCDRDFAGNDWRETVGSLHRATPHSCIILVSAVNDEYLWDEVIRHGGYDVLKKPLQESQVVPAITLALSYVKQCSPTK